jgi:hypothetical protein
MNRLPAVQVEFVLEKSPRVVELMVDCSVGGQLCLGSAGIAAIGEESAT